MSDHSPTLHAVDRLLSFLPALSTPGRTFVETESPGSWPVYQSDVVAFFFEAGKPVWSDYGYVPRRAQVMVSDPEFVTTCSMDEIRTMLTYCVRSERFGDGSWNHLLESGAVLRLLRRLQVLRREMASPADSGS